MVKGILVVNGLMRTPKFEEITEMYKEAAKIKGVEIRVCYNNELAFGVDGHCYVKGKAPKEKIDFVLFLDKDIRLARSFEMMGVRVFNSSRVIETCDDKAMTFMALQGMGIPMPKTLIAPLIYTGMYDDRQDGYIQVIEQELQYPMVVKECYGSFGMQVYKVETQEELKAIRRRIADKPHIYQEFIKSSYGRDVRIHVVGGQVVASMLRLSETDFRANISNGGRMERYECPKAFEMLAIDICEKLGADFIGIDMLFGKEGEPVLCEVNSNAHIKNILLCTGINVAEHIVEYIKKEVDENARRLVNL